MKTKVPLFLSLLLGTSLLTGFKNPEPDQTSWKFIITGDSRGGDNGVNTAILGEIVQEIIAQEAEFILFPGDLVTGASESPDFESQMLTWRQTMQPLYDAGIGVYPVRGNHEMRSPKAAKSWNKIFSGPYALPQNGPTGERGVTYSLSHRNIFIIALDQYVNQQQINQTWLDAQLKINPQPIIIALGHEPAFKLHHNDCLDDHPAQRDRFWQSLQEAGGRYYACGHDHFFDYARIDDGDGDPSNDIGQYVVGTAGAPIYETAFEYNGNNSAYLVKQQHHANQHGYLLGEVRGDQLKLTWYERDPNTKKYQPAWESTPPKHDAPPRTPHERPAHRKAIKTRILPPA